MIKKFIDLEIGDFLYKTQTFKQIDKYIITKIESEGGILRIYIGENNFLNIGRDYLDFDSYQNPYSKITYYTSIDSIRKDVERYIYWINREIEDVERSKPSENISNF